VCLVKCCPVRRGHIATGDGSSPHDEHLGCADRDADKLNRLLDAGNQAMWLSRNEFWATLDGFPPPQH
jgi:hypothetical protein